MIRPLLHDCRRSTTIKRSRGRSSSSSAGDVVKYVLAIALVAAGVFGYTWFEQWPGALRALLVAGGVREIMLLADRVNEFVDRVKPWELARQPGMDAALHDACSVCIEAFRVLTIYLKPVLPALAARVEAFLQVPPLVFADAARAMAMRCNTALVEPPSAMTTVMAFSNAFRVMMSSGLISFSRRW